MGLTHPRKVRHGGSNSHAPVWRGPPYSGENGSKAERPRGQVNPPTSFARAGYPNRQAATSPTLAPRHEPDPQVSPRGIWPVDISSCDPVLPGPVRVTPNGASHGVVRQARTRPQGCHPPRARVPLPTAPAKAVGDERAATRLFSWDVPRLKDTQWHKCQGESKSADLAVSPLENPSPVRT